MIMSLLPTDETVCPNLAENIFNPHFTVNAHNAWSTGMQVYLLTSLLAHTYRHYDHLTNCYCLDCGWRKHVAKAFSISTPLVWKQPTQTSQLCSDGQISNLSRKVFKSFSQISNLHFFPQIPTSQVTPQTKSQIFHENERVNRFSIGSWHSDVRRTIF